MQNLKRSDWMLFVGIAAVIILLLAIIVGALNARASQTGSPDSSKQVIFLPDDIKLPDKALVDNSSKTTDSGGKASTFTSAVVQDKELTLAQLSEFYKTSLADNGWTLDTTYLDESFGQFEITKDGRKGKVWFMLQKESIQLEIAAAPKS